MDAILDVYARHEYDRRDRTYRAEPLLDSAGLPDPDLSSRCSPAGWTSSAARVGPC